MEVSLYSSKCPSPLDSIDDLISFLIDETKIKQELLGLPTSL